MNHLERLRRLLVPVLILAAGVPLAAPPPSAAWRGPLRQLTDVRTDVLGEYAVGDSGSAVEAVTSADPFGANRAHGFQIVRLAGPGRGRAQTRFGGMGRSISISSR